MSVSRSAVFIQQSPDVEVCLDGSWRRGSILGWRHDDGGACEVRVRAVVAGAPCEVWVDLASLRLPEQPAPAPPTVTLVLTPQGPSGVAREPGAPSAATVTLSRAAARERLVAGVLAAPELAADGTGAGLRRRHGGAETAEAPAVSVGAVVGRHRAPAGAGRHRAADQESAAHRAGSASASLADAAASVAAEPVAEPAESDCLTRPLRLGDRLTRPRLPRPDAVVRS
jgi:hypothetical protein